MKNNTPNDVFKQEIKERAFKAIMAQDWNALEALFTEVYVTAYSSGYDDSIHDNTLITE